MISETPLIVICDHDRDYLDMMDELITEEGYRAMVVRGDTDIHQLILREMPALVIIDMPVTNPDSGWNTLNLLRLDPRTKALPVLICTTNTVFLQNNIAHLTAMGCTFLAKPFDLEHMLTSIRERIGPPQRM